MISKIEIILASLPDRENMVAELWVEKSQLAEIQIEGSDLRVELYARRDGASWSIEYPVLLDALEKAARRLTHG